MVFSVICLISFVWSIISGTSAQTAAALLDGAGRAVEVTLALAGVMGIWSGVMAVLREAGAIKAIAKIMKPITRLIFKEDCEEAVACLAANFLGIGNAATPLGIDALCRMQGGRTRATDDSVMLIVLCTACFSPIPTTVLAMRRAAGAEIMFELLPAIWIVGGIGTLTAIVVTKIMCRFGRNDN